MSRRRRIQVARREPLRGSRLVYRDLVDTGGPVIRFSNGHGFLTRDQIVANGWTIEDLDDDPGWEARQGWPPVWGRPAKKDRPSVD